MHTAYVPGTGREKKMKQELSMKTYSQMKNSTSWHHNKQQQDPGGRHPLNPRQAEKLRRQRSHMHARARVRSCPVNTRREVAGVTLRPDQAPPATCPSFIASLPPECMGPGAPNNIRRLFELSSSVLLVSCHRTPGCLRDQPCDPRAFGARKRSSIEHHL